MIGQITPLVKAAGRYVWSAAVLMHIAAATLSAGILGLALGTLGLAIRLERWGPPLGVAGGILFLACALCDAGLWQWQFPSLHRQTPARFQTSDFGPMWRAFVWGADLGQGWTTYISFAGYYGLILWAVLGASPFHGAMVLGAYGLGRGLPVLVAGLVRDGLVLGTKYMLKQSLILRVNAVALAFTAGYLFLGA